MSSREAGTRTPVVCGVAGPERSSSLPDTKLRRQPATIDTHPVRCRLDRKTTRRRVRRGSGTWNRSRCAGSWITRRQPAAIDTHPVRCRAESSGTSPARSAWEWDLESEPGAGSRTAGRQPPAIDTHPVRSRLNRRAARRRVRRGSGSGDRSRRASRTGRQPPAIHTHPVRAGLNRRATGRRRSRRRRGPEAAGWSAIVWASGVSAEELPTWTV